jgi:hypothetical protein
MAIWDLHGSQAWVQYSAKGVSVAVERSSAAQRLIEECCCGAMLAAER